MFLSRRLIEECNVYSNLKVVESMCLNSASCNLIEQAGESGMIVFRSTEVQVVLQR